MKLAIVPAVAAVALLAVTTGARADGYLAYEPGYAYTPAYAYAPGYVYAPRRVVVETVPTYRYVAPAPIVRERRVVVTAPARTIVRRPPAVDAYAYAPGLRSATYAEPACAIDAFGFERCY